MSDVTSTPSRPGSPSASVAGDLPTARPYRFTWDPSSRRPGPESVSGTTEGRGGDYITANHRVPYGVLNTSSTNLTLGTGVLPAEWSSSRHGFHAISTVLNNPHKRQAPPKAHSSLPGVPPADLPRVRRKDFESYLTAITPEWNHYERNTKLGRDGQAQIDAARFSSSDAANALDIDPDPSSLPLRATPLSPLQGKTIPPLNSVPSVFFTQDFNLGDPLTFATVTEQKTHSSSTSSSSSFASFAAQEYQHSDPDSELHDPLALAHSLPLLEKFSHYADTVEQHLVREISIRSTSFFAALTNLRDLQSESSHCLDRITRLRAMLLEVDEGTAKKGLELVRKEGRWGRVRRVKDGVALVGRVVEMTGVARGLVNAGQWGEALGVVEEIEGLWEGAGEAEDVQKEKGAATTNASVVPNGKLGPMPEELEEEGVSKPSQGHPQQQQQLAMSNKPHLSRPGIPISSLYAFSALPSHLRALTMEIAASLSAELVAILKNDLESRIELGTSSSKSENGAVGVDPDQGLKDRLKPLLLNLVRTKGLKEGVLSWREVVLGEVRTVIRKKLPGFDSEDEDGGNGNASGEARAGLANHLRSMSQAEFMVLIQSIYRSLLNGIERLKAQGAVIEELLDSLKPEVATFKSISTPLPPLSEELNDILSSAAELANTLAAKVISYRSEQHAALEFAEFLAFFNDSWAFVVRCEVICRRMIVGLRGTVVGQAKLFLQSFHQIRISRSAKLVEDEVWNPSEVSPALQHIANILVDSAMRDLPELVIKPEDAIFSPVTSAFPIPSTPATGLQPNGDSPASPSLPSAEPTPLNPTRKPSNGTTNTAFNSKHLRIEDRTYYLVSATSEVLVLLLDYLRVIVNLSMLTTDTMSRVIEFLKAFNSRTCQVVLGAGAMRSAGLKNITAKHLALASQSLSIVFELIPYVRETFRRHLSQKQAVMLVEFDKLKRDYQEHQNEIHAKLIAIMGDRLNAHLKTLQTVDWSAPKPEGSVNDYMELLVKETVTLHKVLSRYLALPIVEYVMSQVFAAINHRLSEEYGKIELPNQQAKNRLVADAKYLHQKFGALKNVGAPIGMLETFVSEKSVPRAANVSPPVRSNTISANQRLRGLLSGKVDKALPDPGRAPTPPVPPPADRQQSYSQSQVQAQSHSQLLSPALTTGSSVNGLNSLGMDGSMSGSNLSLAMSPPIEEAAMSRFQGFRQASFSEPSSHDALPLQHQIQPPETEGETSSLPLSRSPPITEGGSDVAKGDSH